MSDNPFSDLDPFIIEAEAAPYNMTIYRYGGSGYDTAARVYNSRIETQPAIVVMCSQVCDISFWFQAAQKLAAKYPVQVRSGGHHHEGMCVEDGVITLDISGMPGAIECEEGGKFAWIPSGRKLGGVIDELAEDRKIVPVGGCGTVCVGGLTHGGGWGASYRHLGATVDKLDRVEMVLTNGKFVTVGMTGFIDCDPGDDILGNGTELFWAIRGGGGGNFGIVTRFRFALSDMGDAVCGFTLHFDKSDRLDIMQRWAAMSHEGDDALTSFCRITVVESDEYERTNPAVLIGGRFFGDEDACRNELEKFLPEHLWKWHDFSVSMSPRGAFLLNESEGMQFADGLPVPPRAYALNIGAYSVETCKSDHEPHKVSSMFPNDEGWDALGVIDDSLELGAPLDGAAYISLHAMGGQRELPDIQDTAFSWRHKPFMLQIQAWWPEGATNAQDFLDWVAAFRGQFDGTVEGAFVAFPDCANDVTDYYATGYYGRLQGAKSVYDTDNIMRFTQGIKP